MHVIKGYLTNFNKNLTALYTSRILEHMKKKKYPSELNTKHIRVNLMDFALLKDLSIEKQTTIAELVHDIITNNLELDVNNTPPYQIQMPIQVSRSITGISRSLKINVRREE